VLDELIKGLGERNNGSAGKTARGSRNKNQRVAGGVSLPRLAKEDRRTGVSHQTFYRKGAEKVTEGRSGRGGGRVTKDLSMIFRKKSGTILIGRPSIFFKKRKGKKGRTHRGGGARNESFVGLRTAVEVA